MSAPTDIPGLHDDRIVLPLGVMRDAARHLCRMVCQGGIHVRPCFLPHVEQRDALVAAAGVPLDAVSGDCLDPVKHGACSGCACVCHGRGWVADAAQ